MKTTVKDWYIVSVFDDEELIGKILWGTCEEDETYRFSPGSYISTSKVEKIFPNKRLIITASGSCYKLIGEGQKSLVQLKDFELLRHGFSPEQITQLNLAPNGIFH
ncbi:hypothetical protein [Pseudoalteromonas arctica]|uniref:Uncharacterized protein n=1 Tax=Pseudoalteromonas arctica TaxID=394751 RepID=A0A7Y0DXC9_9GAMM|nr:hypothetical protein [Pseudoalteromonas arctica]NMM42541.1 hypothetical protein [Pseudoalteromonas arctica]